MIPPFGEFAYIDWLRHRTPPDPRIVIGPGDDAAALATAGFVIAVCGRDYETALTAFDRSFALSSSLALALGFSSIVRAWKGDDAIAVIAP